MPHVRYSNGRRLVDDIIRIANNTPIATLQKDIDISELATLRKKIKPRIAWNVMYMKAYGLVARQNSILRQSYVSFPWPHLYEHSCNIAMLTVSRDYGGEERLLFARFRDPENHTLLELQTKYEHLRTADVESVRQFRHQIRFANNPFGCVVQYGG